MEKIYFSEFCGIPAHVVEDYGAFDVSLLADLPLFVDPFLLFNSVVPEYRELHSEIIRYMCFLRDRARAGHIAKHLVDEWFTFHEVRQNWLGFSRSGNHGRGLGSDFAGALSRNLTTVFRDFGEETVTRGSHMEKLCLIRDGVGRDNISDFTTNLIKGFLAEYSQKFARAHLAPGFRRVVALRKAQFDYRTRSWVSRTYELPFVRGEFVLLTPRDILTKDEAWINRTDLVNRFVDIADALPDGVLRAQVNDYFGRILPSQDRASHEERRDAVTRAIAEFPQVLDYYIKEKEERGDGAASLAQARVEAARTRFVANVRDFVQEFLSPHGFYEIPRDTHVEAKRRLLFLKDVIENKGGHRLFYVDGKPLERESDLQILYRLTWYATTSDLSREVNDGRGPADFKVSRGARDKTLVEFKLAKNSQLERNLQAQTNVYERASDATHPSLKAIVFFTESEARRVTEILKRLQLAGDPDIVLIDARADNKPSGSRA
jgi:hypothetical protein